MGIQYGIYEQTASTLTDLGHVLHYVAPWARESIDSPLRWEGEARWIGFWVLMQSAGDVLLPLLRGWAPEEMTNLEATALLGRTLGELARRAPLEEDRKNLLAQQMRTAVLQDGKFEGRDAVYPYLEPLRDLGYLERVEVNRGRQDYRITASGKRLREAFQRTDATMDRLLSSGLSRIFLQADGISSLRAADADVLPPVLATVPLELTVVLRPDEVPLRAVVLLTQARLLRESPGTWIDIDHANALLRAVSARSDAIYTKRGGSVGQVNVAWSNRSVLEDADIWAVSVPAQSEPSSSILDITHSELPSEGMVDSGAAEHISTMDSPPSIEDAGSEPPLGTTPEPGSAELLPSRGVRITALLKEDISVSLRLWLQYVDALLAPAAPGGVHVFRWGGLSSALHRLYALVNDLPDNRLEEKRKPARDRVLVPDGQRKLPSPCVRPLRCMDAVLQKGQDDWLCSRFMESWQNTAEERQLVRTLLERGLRLAPAMATRMRGHVDNYLDACEKEPDWKIWPVVKESTRALVHDALMLGIWSANELRARLHIIVGTHEPRESARVWLQLLSAERKQYVYTQRRTFLVEDESRLGLESLGKSARNNEDELPIGIDIRGPLAAENERADPPSGAGQRFEFDVQTEARSVFEAKILGRARVHELLVARYAQCGSSGGDYHLDLPEIPTFETVDGEATYIESELGLVAGLRFSHDHSTRVQSIPLRELFAPWAWARRAKPDSQQRLLRARRGLVLSGDPDRRPEERLPLLWSAAEQLITAGEDSKGDAVFALSAAFSLLHLRREIDRIYQDTRVALWLTSVLSPTPLVEALLDVWLPDEVDEVRRVMSLALPIRQAYVGRTKPPGFPSSKNALGELLGRRDKLLELRDVFLSWAPLVANELHNFVRITGDGKEPGDAKSPPPLGTGKAFAEHFREIYEDAASFVSHIYELRNRFVHSGEGFDLSREPCALDGLERFSAMLAPMLKVVEDRTKEGASLEQFWLLAQELAQDMASLQNSRHPISAERLGELLSL